MLTMRNKSVNVSRVQLIENLKENLEVYKLQLQEALEDYKACITLQLQDALNNILREDITLKEVTKMVIEFDPPEDHTDDYIDAIEILEYSVDENINLDMDSFKAYIKNEWSWSRSFASSMAASKLYLSAKL